MLIAMSKRFKHRNRNFQTMFRRHVYYEIEQFAVSYWRLKAGIRDQELINLYHESFCIHAKTLLEFFNRKAEDHMAAAVDFTDASYVPLERERGNELKQILGRVNIEISHLSWARPDNQSDQIGQDYRDKIWVFVTKERQRWVASLRPEFDRSLLPLRLLNGFR
jgi:hypothetical protein